MLFFITTYLSNSGSIWYRISDFFSAAKLQFRYVERSNARWLDSGAVNIKSIRYLVVRNDCGARSCCDWKIIGTQPPGFFGSLAGGEASGWAFILCHGNASIGHGVNSENLDRDDAASCDQSRVVKIDDVLQEALCTAAGCPPDAKCMVGKRSRQ